MGPWVFLFITRYISRDGSICLDYRWTPELKTGAKFTAACSVKGETCTQLIGGCRGQKRISGNGILTPLVPLHMRIFPPFLNANHLFICLNGFTKCNDMLKPIHEANMQSNQSAFHLECLNVFSEGKKEIWRFRIEIISLAFITCMFINVI